MKKRGEIQCDDGDGDGDGSFLEVRSRTMAVESGDTIHGMGWDVMQGRNLIRHLGELLVWLFGSKICCVQH